MADYAIPATMLQYTVQSGAGIDGLKVERVPVPRPGRGEALVKLHTATLNYRDLVNIKGMEHRSTEGEFVPLSCGVGTVIAMGTCTIRMCIGQRVCPTFDQEWLSGGVDNCSWQHLGGKRAGVAREYAVIPDEALVPVPDELGNLEAATLPCAGLTAWNALFGDHVIKPGDVVTLQGTGGVSIAALQFAKMAGAEVIITSSSDAKLARARALGADHVVNYKKNPDWAGVARKLTNGRGAKVVLDVAGSGQLDQTVKMLDSGGHIATIGMLEGEFNFKPNCRFPTRRIVVGSRDQFEEMLKAMVATKIRPVVDRVFSFDRLKDALRLTESGNFFGKIAIAID